MIRWWCTGDRRSLRKRVSHANATASPVHVRNIRLLWFYSIVGAVMWWCLHFFWQVLSLLVGSSSLLSEKLVRIALHPTLLLWMNIISTSCSSKFPSLMRMNDKTSVAWQEIAVVQLYLHNHKTKQTQHQRMPQLFVYDRRFHEGQVWRSDWSTS